MKRLAFVLFVAVAIWGVEFDPELIPFTEEIDLVFSMDTTGSMAVVIHDFRGDIGGMVSELVDRGTDFRIGGTTFGDGVNAWDFDPAIDGFQLTDDADTFIEQLNSTGSSGGGDAPEFQLDALYVSAFEYDWDISRPRAVVMFTDAPYHYPGDGSTSGVDPDLLYELFVGTGIPVFISHSCYSLEATEYYDSLAHDSGGCSYPLSTSWREIFEDIISTVEGYIYFSVGLTDFDGLELYSITLEGMDGYSGSPRTIDLSSFETSSGSVSVGWILHEESLLRPLEEFEYRLVLLSSDGEIEHEGTIEDVKESPTNPQTLSLSTHPNPFNSTVAIDAPQGYAVSITDTEGRKVATLGTGSTSWTPEKSLPSGIYIVKAEGDGGMVTERIVYMK